MRTVHDLRMPDERARLGLALSPMIEMFDDKGVPLGRTWDALTELLDHMRTSAHDRFREAPRGSGLNRLLAALGLREKPGADLTDLAELEGYLRALVDVRVQIAGFVQLGQKAFEAERDRPRARAAAQAASPRFTPGQSGV